MKRGLLLGALLGALLTSACQAGFLGDLTGGFNLPAVGGGALDDSTIVKGLKEALAVGTDKAVKAVGQQNGYFSNDAIKILLPDKVRTAADLLGKIGYQKQVDDFVLSMNRAAEKAAPKAAALFVDAVKDMSVEDARGILNGGDTSATEYFRKKTSDKLYHEFKPTIATSMEQVGVTKSYKDMMGKYQGLPFVNSPSLDLDHYVTTKSLDGLFHMLGEEEKKIRTDPAARATELLRKVFGR